MLEVNSMRQRNHVWQMKEQKVLINSIISFGKVKKYIKRKVNRSPYITQHPFCGYRHTCSSRNVMSFLCSLDTLLTPQTWQQGFILQQQKSVDFEILLFSSVISNTYINVHVIQYQIRFTVKMPVKQLTRNNLWRMQITNTIPFSQ